MKLKSHSPWSPLLALVLIVCSSGCGKRGATGGGQPGAVTVARIEAVRQAGQPVTLAELNSWYPEPPAGENAAVIYAEAFAALAVVDPKSPAFLTRNQAALALLHKAAEKSQCRYPIDLGEGPSVKLAHLAKIKTCAQLLGREAVTNAAKGRLDLAAQDLLDGLRLARSLDQEPLLISQLVRISSDSILQSALEGAVAVRAFPEEQLVRLQAALREEEKAVGASMIRPFAAERCTVISLFQMPLPDYEKLYGSAGTNTPLGPATEFENYRQSATGVVDLNLCLDFYSNWLAIASAPFPASLETAAQWAPEADAQIGQAKAKGYRVASVMLPALNAALERAADCVGQLRAAEAALAVERYRLDMSSAVPDSLGELVPKYCAAVPDDPYDGKPLRYKTPSQKGYVVYSLGRNRQDDGGTPRPSEGKADGPYDLTFVVRR